MTRSSAFRHLSSSQTSECHPLDGLEATRRIARLQLPEAPRVVILTTFGLDKHEYEALRSEASGPAERCLSRRRYS